MVVNRRRVLTTSLLSTGLLLSPFPTRASAKNNNSIVYNDNVIVSQVNQKKGFVG